MTLAFFGGAVTFYLLRGLRLEGGDTEIFLSPIHNYLWKDSLVYYVREPLAHFIVHRLYLLTHDHQVAYAISSSVSGGFYLSLLCFISRHPLFLAVNLLTMTTMNFVGHMENYAPLMVALGLYFMLLARALEPHSGVRPVHVVLAFALSYFCHKLTLFFSPAMIWLIVARRDGCWVRRSWQGRPWEGCLLVLICMAILDIAPGVISVFRLLPIDLMYVGPNERYIDWLTPPTRAIAAALHDSSVSGSVFLFTLGEPKHWLFFFSFLLMGAPLGLPILFVLRRRIRTDAARALLTAAACGIVWIFFWHPRREWLDWDLFSLAGVPINLLAGALIANLFTPDDRPERSSQLSGKSA